MGKGNLLNKPCDCGSGKKYKKCCMNTPKEKEILTGANAETLVEFLSSKTFLKPWVFRSPKYTSDNKEFCDVAILFRGTLILIEVTGSKFDPSNPQRYLRKVKKKHGQLNIAHRIVTNKSKEVQFVNDYFDFKTTFGEIDTVHKIFLSTGDGEMKIAENPGETNRITFEDLGRYCGFYNDEDGIHSFTLSELSYASEHINTLKDFDWYLQFEKKFLTNDFGDFSGKVLPVVDSEREDLIAVYLLTFSQDEELNISGVVNLSKIFGDNDLSESTMIMYSATGTHKNLESDDYYREIISERKISYFWDSLVTDMAAQCQTMLRVNSNSTENVVNRMEEMRKVLEVLSHTSRFERVKYSEGIIGSQNQGRDGKIFYRNIFSLAKDSDTLFSYLRRQYQVIPSDNERVSTAIRHARTVWCRVNYSDRMSAHKERIKRVCLITHHIYGENSVFTFSLADPIEVTRQECEPFLNF